MHSSATNAFNVHITTCGTYICDSIPLFIQYFLFPKCPPPTTSPPGKQLFLLHFLLFSPSSSSCPCSSPTSSSHFFEAIAQMSVLCHIFPNHSGKINHILLGAVIATSVHLPLPVLSNQNGEFRRTPPITCSPPQQGTCIHLY